MNGELVLHCGASKVTREELIGIPTPAATETWRPVPHYEVAELVANEAQRRGYEIVKEEYGLTPKGDRMFGVLRFKPENSGAEYTRALGIRNSHNKQFALGVVAGCSIFICDNLAFSGEITIHRKHTSGIEIDELIPQAFDKLAYQYVRLEQRIGGMKLEAVSIDQARVITVMAAEIKAIPSCDIIEVLDEFKEPRHEEFRESTKWSLYNSFTETAKKYSPARADFCYRRLAGLFEMQ
ncbi:MAG TPA: hypothetical protein DET40_05065 [Lentisphaeria bacterium]|nr:MAG: hypothetical protein A2X45_13640 [Lentisphaerae bacterium GWF2_50_93]HCE42897.1 hypothetical protein [Lentisphaeria bacterium]